MELCWDLMQRNRLEEPTEAMVNNVLLELKDVFQQAGKEIAKDLQLPEIDMSNCELEHGKPREIREELDYFHEELAEEVRSNEDKLSVEHKVLHKFRPQLTTTREAFLCN